jgi:uncharacterized surface protein with fasciclin (FAS1) repeats
MVITEILKRANTIAFATVFVAASMLLAQIQTADAKRAVQNPAKPGQNTIVEIVLANDGEFDVLQAAVIRAGLAETLSGGRQLTVFAPTDQAFVTFLGAITEAQAISTINTIDPSVLGSILAYHVIDGRQTSQSVLARSSYRTIGGEVLSETEVLNAGILSANISARNGVIHVIGSVLIP